MTAQTRGVLMASLAALIATLAFGACGGDSDGQERSDATNDDLNFYFVYHEPASSPFPQIVRKGMEEAADDLGVKVTFRGPEQTTFQATEQQRLIESAEAAGADGIITSNPAPDGLNPAIKKAADAGIPVILVNVGEEAVADTGALGFVGQREADAGDASSRALCERGAKHLLWVTVPEGIAPSFDARNEGVHRGFACGEVTDLVLQVEDFTGAPSRVANAMKAAIKKDPSIDSVNTAGNLAIPPLLATRAAVGDRASEITWMSFDVTDVGLQAVADRKMDLLVDQQPFLQGYLPVLYLTMFKRYGLTPQPATSTGPNLIDSQQAKTILPLSAKKLR
jgi:simple sugar transport system substrate-binding protein